MKEFMLLIRKEGSQEKELPANQQQEFLKKVMEYISRLTKEGKLKAAQPLERNGKIISGSASAWKDGPYNETKEVIAGYYHILAKDIDEAIAIAKENPEFEYRTDARIEVRPIKMAEKTTGYKYPSQNG